MIEAASKAPPASLQVLLRGVVDYAGLFPPASLSMAAAVPQYVGHRAEPNAWMLGRFILPAARLEEFEAIAAPSLPRDGTPWLLSALIGTDIEEDVARIDAFNATHQHARNGAARVDTVEIKTHAVGEIAHAAAILDQRFDTFMEIPVADDPADLIAAIARTRAKAKIRTGGVTPDAFPRSEYVVRFIASCVAKDLPFKATAGLHHPWRSEYRLSYAPDAPEGTMYGFLNVLLTTAALRDGFSRADAVSLLEERDPGSVEFTDRGARWRGRELSLASIERARDRMLAFGSCSFREPVDDLRAITLL